MYWFGTEGKHNIMIMELLGKSLEDLFKRCHKKLSLPTILALGEQMVHLAV